MPPAPVALLAKADVEVLRLIAVLPDSMPELEAKDWGYTLGYALRMGMLRRFALSEDDIEFQFEEPWPISIEGTRCRQAAITFIDPHLGGSGYLPRIAESFHLVARSAVEHLDHPGCETACYRCLKTYRNQRHHEYLRWPRIIDDLAALTENTPEPRALHAGDVDDPRPWLEAYAAGVGSPLELKFLRLFEQQGLRVEKQVPVSPSDGEPPISRADFVVSGLRIAIYVDGAAFHVGDRLRRDRFIRTRLRQGAPPWQVVELRAADLATGGTLVARIAGLR